MSHAKVQVNYHRQYGELIEQFVNTGNVIKHKHVARSTVDVLYTVEKQTKSSNNVMQFLQLVPPQKSVVAAKMGCIRGFTLNRWKLTFGFPRFLIVEYSIRSSHCVLDKTNTRSSAWLPETCFITENARRNILR